MNSNIIIDSVLNNDFSGFKKSLYEDLQQKLLTNEDVKMVKRYNKAKSLSQYIKNVIREAEEKDEIDVDDLKESFKILSDNLRGLRRVLRESGADTEDVEDAVKEAKTVVDDALDGDEDIEESLRVAKRKLREAKEELEDVDVDEDDEEVIESLQHSYKKINTIQRVIEEIEKTVDDVDEDDEIEGSTDDVKESRRAVREEDDEIEGSTDDVRESDDDDDDDDDLDEEEEIEGSTDDVKESIKVILSKLKEADEDVKDVDEDKDEEECVESCKVAYPKIAEVKHVINTLNNMNINESEASNFLVNSSRALNKIAKMINENENEEPDDEEEVKESCLRFKKVIAKGIKLLEELDDKEEDDDINESFGDSLVSRMSRLY